MAATVKKRTRRGRKPAAALSRPDFPYTMRLPDGRTVCIEVPGRWVTADRDGTPAFEPDGVAFLDRVRALFLSALDRPPSPGYITRLREGLALTQRAFGERVGVDKMTVSRWERGAMRPSDEALRAIEKLRKGAVRRGVAISV
ncbi:MAG: helix-turn-helix domain-containing protein [Phycisphaerae bacterium]|nr:helix-turn-helix domain-containing protein [Phycisphaerae bacterium]